MEDRRKPETSTVLLEDLSMRASLGTTDSGVEKHVAKMLDTTCDPSRLNMPSQSSVMAGLRMESLSGVLSIPDAQDIQDETKCSIFPSQSDACVGCPSSDLSDSKVDCLDESFFRYTFEDLLETEQGEDGIWSILTDRLYYLQLTNSEPIQFQEANLTKTAKKKLFDAANNNIPNRKNYYKSFTQERKDLNFDVKGKLCRHDDQYDTLNITLDRNFNPNKNITTTYLWSHMSEYLSQPKIVRTDATWFPQGNFDITINGVTEGNLLDGTPIRVKTLVDSGATKPILSKSFYDKTKFLHQYPKIQN